MLVQRGSICFFDWRGPQPCAIIALYFLITFIIILVISTFMNSMSNMTTDITIILQSFIFEKDFHCLFWSSSHHSPPSQWLCKVQPDSQSQELSPSPINCVIPFHKNTQLISKSMHCFPRFMLSMLILTNCQTNEFIKEGIDTFLNLKGFFIEFGSL